MPRLKKLAPKYARHALIDLENFRKRDLSRLKSVSSFHFSETPTSRKAKLTPIKQIYQIIKSQKKFIRHFAGIDLDLCLAKELPQLSVYKLSYFSLEQSAKYKILAYFPALKRIFFDFEWPFPHQEEASIISVLQQNQTRLLQAISRMRSINKLSMKFSLQSSSSVLALLQVAGSCSSFLHQLNYFSLGLNSRSASTIEENLIQTPQVQAALRNVTHLTVKDYKWFDAVFEKENLGSLRDFQVLFVASMVSETTIRKLSNLRFFKEMKHLNLNFKSFSEKMENAFLESFTLPQDLESIELTLQDFVWADKDLKLTEDRRKMIEDSFKNHPRFQGFYNQWAGLNNPKTFQLTIVERLKTRCCPKLAFSFAEGMMKRMKNLTKLHYWHVPTFDSNFPEVHLELKDFWSCLENSKDTIEDISINLSTRSKINFFEKESSEKMVELPKLKTLRINGDVSCDMNPGDFLTKFSKGTKAHVKFEINTLHFKHETASRDFFANIIDIPRNMEMTLRLTVSHSNWEDILSEYMTRIREEGTLKLDIKVYEVTNDKIFELIREKSARNSCLQRICIADLQSRGSWIIQNGNLRKDEL